MCTFEPVRVCVSVDSFDSIIDTVENMRFKQKATTATRRMKSTLEESE